MIDQDNSPTSGEAINVGIYGCTKAGKTRFLFELLNGWERTRRLIDRSENCLKFLETVESEIETHDGSMPTVATTEGIRVKVRRDGNDPPLELIFRDLRGELLSEEIDQIASLNRDGVIPTQVRRCDAFLFFFDPASSEKVADIDGHHKRELKRATMFIKHVMEVRQNRLLPIIFVLTHLDRWEGDADISAKADRWTDEVHAKLVELHGSRLRHFHPRTIVDRSRIFSRISSVGDRSKAHKRLEAVIDQLNELVADSRSHQRRLRKAGLYALIAGAAVLFTLPFVIWLLSSMGASPSTPHTAGKSTERIVAERSEQQILTRLDNLERMLNAHPRDARLPSIKEATELNQELRWLVRRLEPNSGGTNGLSEKTVQRMRSALELSAELIGKKADTVSHSPADLTRILAAYLEDLPDLESTSPRLAGVQARYWELLRAQVVDDVAGIIKRRHEVNSPPMETLGELVTFLDRIGQEVRRCKVFGSGPRKPQQALRQEIETTRTFCEDRKRTRSYPVVFRVVSAFDPSKKEADLALRDLRIVSPHRNDWLAQDGVALIPDNEQIPVDIYATVHWGPNCWDGYQNSVNIEIEIEGIEIKRRESWHVTAKSEPKTAFKLDGSRRLEARRSDKLSLKAHIRVVDGTFIFHGRGHGEGAHSTTLGSLLDKEQVIELDRYNNKVVLTAKRAGGNKPNSFGTKETAYRCELGLGIPITCILSVHEGKDKDGGDNWTKLHEFDLTTEPGPLAPLGLPLLRRDQDTSVKMLQWKEMKLELEFSGFPGVPRLIWDATASGKEQKP